MLGSAEVSVWPDGTTWVLAIPCLHHCSVEASFGLLSRLADIFKRWTSLDVCYCVGNNQVVGCVDRHPLATPFPPASMSSPRTWKRVVPDFLGDCAFIVGAGYVKCHVSIHGNKIANSIAKCLCHTRHLPKYPERHTVTFDDAQCIFTFRGAQRKRLYLEYDHTGIRVRLRFHYIT